MHPLKHGINVLLSSILFLPGMMAQNSDAAATEILKQLAQNIQDLQNISYDFELKISYPEEEPTLMKGTYLQKGERYRLETPSHHFISDGKSKWVVDLANKEVQIHDFIPSDGTEISDPQAILNIYQNPHFDYRLAFDGLMEGKDVQIIEFKPRDRSGELAKASLIIDKDLGDISSMDVLNRDGSKLDLQIHDVRKNTAGHDNTFVIQ